MADNKKTAPTRGRSIGDVQRRLPVIEKETIYYAFFVTAAPRAFTGQYGKSWSVTCANAETGEAFVILMGGNSLRDQDMEAMADEFHRLPDTRFGPLVLSKESVKGRDTWNLEDAPTS